MCNCCNLNFNKLNEKFNISYENTGTGVLLNIEPKDKTRVKSLQKFIEAYRDFCDCC